MQIPGRRNDVTRPATVAVVMVCAFAVAADLPSFVESELDPVITAGVRALHKDSMSEAATAFDSLIVLRPDRPIGYFFKAAVYQAIIDDYRNPSYQSRFDRTVSDGIERGEAIRRANEDDTRNLLYLGGLYGYRGINKALRGDWWGGFKDARKAKSILEEVLRLDPAVEDVYYGLGSYYYWAAVKSGFVSFLVGGDKEKGIRFTIRTIQHGHYARTEATYALLRIYYNEGMHDKVLAYWRQLKPGNPTDPFANWFVIRSQIRLGRYDEGEAGARALLSYFQQSPYYDPAAEFECRYLIAWALEQKGDEAEALLESRTALAFYKQVEERESEVVEYIHDRLQELLTRIAID
jgi:tetratricopeptide (TPR) repeat protein